jgi:protein disulfide-isomerase
MCRRLSLFSLVVLLAAGRAYGVEWLTDFNTALEKANRENKTVFLDFTGSDWCIWCKRLKSEVLDQPRFEQYARDHLILVEVDFPHNQTLSRDQQKANHDLMESMGVGGFPTVMLIAPDGRRLGHLSYRPGGPEPFITEVESHLGSHENAAKHDDNEQPRKTPPSTYVPPGPVRPVNYGALKLKSISGPKDRRIVLINNTSFMAGESGKVKSDGKEVLVVCNEIRDSSVLVTCDGKPAELKLEIK